MIHGDAFPDALALLLLDTAVNMGSITALRLLQRALNVQENGLVGHRTLTAVIRFPAQGAAVSALNSSRNKAP
ncbi:MAG TPA: hypothetical protein P5329_08820 [Candidatus Competibacteraceae bacterium]|nr:hypothetical protein [Candidatus Competibacteraceae bacterium]